MKKNIHFFSQNVYKMKDTIIDKIGIRGKQAMEFASLDLPILPGFIIDADVAAHLSDINLKGILKSSLKKSEELTGKVFNEPEKPLLVKIVISPNLAIVNYPTLHNFGLTDATIPGFNSFVGEDSGHREVLYLIHGYLEIEAKIAELEEKPSVEKAIRELIQQIEIDLFGKNQGKNYKKLLNLAEKYLPDGFFSDAYVQLELALKRISHMLDLDNLDEEDAALLVQPMVYGNFGKDSASGNFFTRNIVTGEDKLSGIYNINDFNSAESEGKDINKIDKKFLESLQRIGRKVEDHFKEIRSIRFTIEQGKVWLIDQRPVMTKSTQSDIKTLLDLVNRKIIDDVHMIKAIKPGQLNEILHPIIDLASVKNMKKIVGGIAGAPGAAIGRAYFTTDALLNAYKMAQQLGEDTKMILCMPATFAEDVKAIEVATGVLSSEGGYAAHASVVARQYGKVSLVHSGLKIRGKKATIGEVPIKEGDLISINVPQYGEPQIYIGKADLIEPDPKESGLLDFVEAVKKYVKDFHVRVNADKPRDAALALKFGAKGIGLCRTEHMFFDENRINVFRQMIVSDSQEKRKKALKKLKVMQKTDFYKLFKIMAGKDVTVRLLDAPLHEFLPHNEDEMKKFLDFLKAEGEKVNEKEIRIQCDAIREFNPMLGHRGCRIAVSYPEVYHMQIEAIFEALYKLKDEGVKVFPEIMIPLIMNEDELKLIMYGKRIEGSAYKGIVEFEEELRAKKKAKPVPYKIGTMIELPGAALGAGEIARYAQFFSFGTNDLTQTTIGLSRDDYTSFMPDYTQFDIINGNPFQKLDDRVKELISIAVRRGTMTRPELKKGLCGEHGAIPENIKFCMDAGLDYVSCSVYSVPIANLAVAQLNLSKE
ncbi:MAG: pyruvate, phosphate dikinase [Spirochaetales bacterium]|nr:pyruvate, phosphate dikinase [Spirochaetales bacterium]